MTEELDNDFVPESDYPFRQTLRWWERRRWWYALALLCTQLAVMLLMPEETAAFGIDAAVVGSLFYLFAANVCYCLGWGIEFLAVYYFKARWEDSNAKVVLFVLGLVFSIFTTFIFYAETLHQYYWIYGRQIV